MENRYIRNRLYLTEKEQDLLKSFPIILGGAGIGSVIAECLLRLGFETLTIIDGDTVELSNLNRQNYIEDDIEKNKVDAIKDRLLAINKNAQITTFDCFISKDNIHNIIGDQKIAINALDFTSDIPLLFDKICQTKDIPVLHPYNIGWGALVTVIGSNNLSLDTLESSDRKFNELEMVEYVSSYLRFWRSPQKWIDDIIEKYKNEKESLPPPQLSIASWTAAAMCTHIAYNIASDKPIKEFPEFYLSTIMENY